MSWKEFMKEECGYDTISTFWEDFSIAEPYGESAVIDTFDRAFNEWKHDYMMLTELVMVLNHKLWQFGEDNPDNPYALLYNDLWTKADTYAMEHLKGSDLEYFLEVTD